MGQEIEGSQFTQEDFQRFLEHLQQETELLDQYLGSGRFDNQHTVAGFELEAWLTDKDCQPAPVNEEFLQRMNSPLVCPELASFNVEFNFTPQDLKGSALSTIEKEMKQLWQTGCDTADDMGAQLVMIGILPTAESQHFTMDNISSMNRFHALNDQVLKLRQSRPLELNILGNDHFRSSLTDVMFESATTSFQIHLQVPIDLAVRAYNASVIVSAATVAVSANSPFLCGKDLWAETRIPLFEQAVEVGGYEPASHGPMRRVTFGSGYVNQSIFEIFKQNLDHYPVLLPDFIKDPAEHFSHVRLHNGTLWRWNRPLIGIDDNNYHIRIEHRVVPAGPSVIDTIANAAFFYGLATYLIASETPPEKQLPFNQARDNFYHTAKNGLDAQVIWLDGNKHNIRTLALDKLLDNAADGLQQCGVDGADINLYLGTIRKRVEKSLNGAAWQRGFVNKYGKDMQALTAAYIDRQNSGEPVHDWDY